jgi:NAD-dependent deacetylase
MNIQPFHPENYRSIFILTGAGISVASGLPPYRGPGGLWEQADIARMVDGANLPESLPDLWRLYSARRRAALDAQPNVAHHAIATFQRRVFSTPAKALLATQNVDHLHTRAGSVVLELHGSAFRSRCLDIWCSQPSFYDEAIYENVPHCPTCGGFLRPDVVLFNENLSERILETALNVAHSCDLFLAIGTSGVVWPAAAFVQIAVNSGARTINVNVEPSGNTAFQEEYIGAAQEILPRLLG